MICGSGCDGGCVMVVGHFVDSPVFIGDDIISMTGAAAVGSRLA